MQRWRCKGSVTTADREYAAGDVIDLEDEHSAQLLSVDKLEAEPVKAEPVKSARGGGEVSPVSAPKSEPASKSNK